MQRWLLQHCAQLALNKEDVARLPRMEAAALQQASQQSLAAKCPRMLTLPHLQHHTHGIRLVLQHASCLLLQGNAGAQIPQALQSNSIIMTMHALQSDILVMCT
jgi:hypothetical protein